MCAEGRKLPSNGALRGFTKRLLIYKNIRRR